MILGRLARTFGSFSIGGAAGLLALTIVLPARAQFPPQNAHSIALHMHGSFSEGPGSMEWHAAKAQQYQVDAIWWTDHDWRIDHWNHTTEYDFEGATVNPPMNLVSETDQAYPQEERLWEREGFWDADYDVAVVDTLASQGTKSLRLSGRDMSGGANFRSIYFRQSGTRFHNMYSLAKRVRLRFSVYPELLDPSDAKIVLEVELSEHPAQWHVLRYVLGTMDEEGPNSTALPYQLGQWNTFEVDVTGDAITQFTLGGVDSLRAEDNSLYRVRLGVEVRHGQEGIVYLDDYQILTDETLDADDMLAKIDAFGDLYETMYPAVSHFTGSEISRWRAQPHLNAYLPEPALVDYTGTAWNDSIYYAVDQMQALGGAVSINHMYGVGIYTNGQIETPEEKAWRVLEKTREMVATRCYGADALEVGYRIRSGVPIEDYLSSWDALTGNAIFVTGEGVSDSHGSSFLNGWGPWDPGNHLHENNFVTWLYADQIVETDLIDALKSGRAYFGDPNLIDADGTVDLVTTEGFPMGRVVVTDRSSHDVIVRVTGVPNTVDVRLLQGEIRENSPVEYIDVNYLRDEMLTGTFQGTTFLDTVTVDTTVPSFVRIEVSEMGPWAFSNPIHFVPEVPDGGIVGGRVATVLGDIRILDAEALTLRDVTLAPILTIRVDEDAPGLGAATIDTGTLGEPTAVLGVTSSSFDAGILSLSGFTGANSLIQILWGPTGVSTGAEEISEVRLSRGSPNPFGQGIVCEYALPRSGQVFLEVLDVRGRRVRIVLDERREAGVHRVEWDGTGPYGRPVADGVYFLRLSTLGESLVTKAVKIR